MNKTYIKVDRQELLSLIHNQRQKCITPLDVEWHERMGKTYLNEDDYKLLLTYWEN